MSNSEMIKQDAERLITKGFMEEASNLLLLHFRSLKSKNISCSNLIRESDYFLDTVLKVANQ